MRRERAIGRWPFSLRRTQRGARADVDHEGSEMSVRDYKAPTLEELAGAAKRSYRTVEEMAYQVIRQGIVSGVFRPGERLPQDAIAKALGVSRIPVRAGLRQLEAEGFVTLLPHRGGTVKALSIDEVRESYELRVLLETHALRVACGRVTPEEISELEALEADVEAAGDPSEWVDKRHAFYRRAQAAHDQPIPLGQSVRNVHVLDIAPGDGRPANVQCPLRRHDPDAAAVVQ